MVKISKWIIPQIIVFLILGLKNSLFLAFFWIIIHELCHCLVALSLGVKMKQITLGPLGASLELEKLDDIGYEKEVLICLAGPLANLAIALIFYFLKGSYDTDFIIQSFNVNLVLGLFNLLPAYPLDGSRILRGFLSTIMFYKKAHNLSMNISYFVSSLILLVFILFLFIHKLNLSLLLCSIFIFYLTYKEKKRIMYIMVGDMINKRRKFQKNKCLESKILSVHYKQGLVNVFSMVDKNKFNYFLVLNDDMRVIGELYEDELVDGLKTHGNITLEEFLMNI